MKKTKGVVAMEEVTKNVKPETREALERMKIRIEMSRLEVEAKKDELIKALEKYHSQTRLYEMIVKSLNTNLK